MPAFYPPPFTPKHKPTSRVQCTPCVQANMKAIAEIFLCIVPIIQPHVSKWYSTNKSPNYAQKNCKNVRQMCKKPYNFPLGITLSQYFLALPYACCRVQEGCQTLNPLAYNPQSRLSFRSTWAHLFLGARRAPRRRDPRFLLPPSKLLFLISLFNDRCLPSPLKALNADRVPHSLAIFHM